MSIASLEYASPHKPPSHFAKVLGTHPNTVIRWMRDGVLFSDGSRRRPRHVRTPGGYRATDQDMAEFLECVKADRSHPVDGPTPTPAPKKRVAAMAAALVDAGF